MKENIKEIGKRLCNTGTIVAIAGAVIIILNQLGFIVDNTKVMYVINSICGIGVALGVLNNPSTPRLTK